MSWTTVCDLLMNSYHGKQCLDSTEYHNNAQIAGNISTHLGFVTFQGTDAQLAVPVRDDSLSGFGALRVQALVRPKAITRRYNIVEGWMSFAVFIESDGRLMGSIYDGQQWIVVDSGSTKIPPNKWSRVSFEYDGVNIAKLTLENAIVGSRFDMSHSTRQPQQLIALGHWPRGDGRYTLHGDLGHVRIERRNQENIWRDAMETAFCRRRLSPAQADAKREIEYLVSTLDPSEIKRLSECAKRQYEEMRHFFHRLRGSSPREVIRLRQLGEGLRAAWCCSFDIAGVRQSLLDHFPAIADKLESEEGTSPEKLFEEFWRISKMCTWKEYPYNRIRELSLLIFPDLRLAEMDLQEIVKVSKLGGRYDA